jgi:hypothetical protein
MQSKEPEYFAISRRRILEAFVKRMFLQPNIKKICSKEYPDYMVVRADCFDQWVHDMGVVLGKSIQDVIDD